MRYEDPKLTAEDVAEMIGWAVDAWPGNCYAVATACLKNRVVAGRAAYGHYHGPIAPTSIFAGKPFARHGWVDREDGRVWDPTRWVFEDVEPYIYLGPSDHYDFGGNQVRERMLTPAPPAGKPVHRLKLPAATRAALGALLGVRQWDGRVNERQLHWLAVYPLHKLGDHAGPLYREIVRVRRAAFIPVDNRERVLEAG